MSSLAIFQVALLASSALAAPSLLTKRADTNTDTSIHLTCASQDIPNPVAGTGTGSSSTQLYILTAGQKGEGKNCAKDPNNANCQTCTFPADYGFKSDISTRICNGNPACSIFFSYNGHDYDSAKDGQCTSQENLQAFGQETDTICYFNA